MWGSCIGPKQSLCDNDELEMDSRDKADYDFEVADQKGEHEDTCEHSQPAIGLHSPPFSALRFGIAFSVRRSKPDEVTIT